MSAIYRTFEDLDLYKAARTFRKAAYRLAKTLPEEERYGLAPQMRRAAVSLTNNIAEGHGRFHYQENIHFLRQARGSLQELIDDVNVCLDEHYADQDWLVALKQEGYQLLKQFNAYIKYLQKCKAGQDGPSTQLPITNYQLPVRGFTLVEIMLVVIIIGVLAAMVIPRFAGRTEQAKIARAASDLAAIALALDLYELDLGNYPVSLEELVAREASAGMGEETRMRWNGPYLKKGLPRDPWGRPYQYVSESAHQQDYDLSSLGPDGQRSNDDVANWW